MTSVIVIAGLLVLVQIDSSRIRPLNHLAEQRTDRPIVDKDDGGGLTFEQDKPRIDLFAEDMKGRSSAEGYIIAYGGLESYKNEARTRLRCIQNYLMTAHGIPRSRLKLIDGGYRPEVSVNLFLVNRGDPKPTPFAIVNREAVRMTKAPKYPCGKTTHK